MTVHGLFAVDFYHNGSICGNRIVRILGMMGITLIWLAPYYPQGNPIGVYTCYCLEITEAHSRARAFVSAAVCAGARVRVRSRLSLSHFAYISSYIHTNMHTHTHTYLYSLLSISTCTYVVVYIHSSHVAKGAV